MNVYPFLSAIKTFCYLLLGPLQFPRNRIGEVVKMKDGQEFMIFRQVIVEPHPSHPAIPGAVFRVRFQVAQMSPKANKKIFPPTYSLLHWIARIPIQIMDG